MVNYKLNNKIFINTISLSITAPEISFFEREIVIKQYILLRVLHTFVQGCICCT